MCPGAGMRQLIYRKKKEFFLAVLKVTYDLQKLNFSLIEIWL